MATEQAGVRIREYSNVAKQWRGVVWVHLQAHMLRTVKQTKPPDRRVVWSDCKRLWGIPARLTAAA